MADATISDVWPPELLNNIQLVILLYGRSRKLTKAYVHMVYENQLCKNHPLKIHRGRDICRVCMGLSAVQPKQSGQEAINVL